MKLHYRIVLLKRESDLMTSCQEEKTESGAVVQCSCIEFLSNGGMLSEDKWKCDVEEGGNHDCVCRFVANTGFVFEGLVADCLSTDIHGCICDCTVLRCVENEDGKAVIEKGDVFCRSVTGHYCVCLKNGPTSCQANRHIDCICSTHGFDECRLIDRLDDRHNKPTLTHYCCCHLSSPEAEFTSCRARGTHHSCICVEYPSAPGLCQAKYGMHDCSCEFGPGNTTVKADQACRARLHGLSAAQAVHQD